jgi:valyl-tRNA synthetase
VEANRNFANKVWNAGRFVISALEKSPQKSEKEPVWSTADEFIHARMRSLTREVNHLFENYQYGEAGRQIYDFFWSEFADWYIELAKLQLAEGGDRAYYTAWTLVRVLDKCLRLLHPFTPFVTEELWQALKQAVRRSNTDISVEAGWADALIIAKFPESSDEENWEKPAILNFQNGIMEIVKSIRNIRLENKVAFKEKLEATLVSTTLKSQIEKDFSTICSLCNLSALHILEKLPEDNSFKSFPSSSLPSSGSTLFLHINTSGLLTEKRDQLETELADINNQIQRLEKLLGSDFSIKAPEAVVQKEKDRLSSFQETATKLKKQIEAL